MIRYQVSPETSLISFFCFFLDPLPLGVPIPPGDNEIQLGMEHHRLVLALREPLDGVNVFLEEFWSSRIGSREKTVGKHHLINGVSRDENAYLSSSRIVG